MSHRPGASESRITLLIVGLAWVFTGIGVFADPARFYATVPGLQAMGPYNIHFIRDVGLAFLASGGATAWAAHASMAGVAMAGIAWPLLHAAFHLQIWAHRGFPFDQIFAFDLVAVIAPPVLAVAAIRSLVRSRGGALR